MLKHGSSTKISKESYYAGAIIDSYNWQEIGIEEFTIEQRNTLLKKLQEQDIIALYQRAKDTGIDEKNIPSIILNTVIKGRQDEQHSKLSIAQVEEFLGYYDVDGTDIRLRDYQRKAVENTDAIFEEKRFASVTLPTGAGKSFVAITELLKHKNENMLYMAPSDEILEQLQSYIVKYVHGNKGTLGKTREEIIKEVFPNLTLETYPGLLAKRGKEIIEKEYDFIVLDELHRTGAKEWEGKLDKLLENQLDTNKVLGITATPTRDSDGRNMAEEVALKLGYTEEEINDEKHVAIDINLMDAIKLGMVVNPKVIESEYELKNNGSMEKLLNDINEVTDEEEKQEKLEVYDNLRKRVENADGVEKILNENIKQGEKWLVFVPVTDKGELEYEDEDGNKIGKRSGEDRIKEYEQLMQQYMETSGVEAKFYSMLGSYGKKKNEEQLQAFASDDTEKTKYMLVMNKANEGLHVDLRGEIWFRALDENSLNLCLQQAGRVIYSEDPDTPTKEEDRPIIIDLANNLLTVNMEKNLKKNSNRDDLKLLTIVVDWAKENRNSRH